MPPVKEAVNAHPNQSQQLSQVVAQAQVYKTPNGHLQKLTGNIGQQDEIQHQRNSGAALSGLHGCRLDLQIGVHLPGVGADGAVDEEFSVAVHIFPAVFCAQLLNFRVRYIAEAGALLLGF